MKDNMLRTIIRHFDDVVKDVDFENLPQRESKEYRELLKKTANDKIFFDGRYSETTEWTLEIFDREDVQQAVADLRQFNALTEAERQRLRFYLDLKNMCYPLFKGDKVDWQAWPWNMIDGYNSLENIDICDIIHRDEYIYLGCALLYDLCQQVIKDKKYYSSVARNMIAMDYDFEIKCYWNKENTETEEGLRNLNNGIGTVFEKLIRVENHNRVGEELGFDFLEQSLYDAVDTYIDPVYEFHQIAFARKMAEWIRENWNKRTNTFVYGSDRGLGQAFYEILAETRLSSIILNDTHTLNIILMDILGESDIETADDDDWKDD